MSKGRSWYSRLCSCFKKNGKDRNNGNETHHQSRGISQPRQITVVHDPVPSNQHSKSVNNTKIKASKKRKRNIQPRNIFRNNINENDEERENGNNTQKLGGTSQPRQRAVVGEPVSLNQHSSTSNSSNHTDTLPTTKILNVRIVNNNNVVENKNVILNIKHSSYQKPQVSSQGQTNINERKPLIRHSYETSFEETITIKTTTQIGFSDQQCSKTNNFNTKLYPHENITTYFSGNKVQNYGLCREADNLLHKRNTKSSTRLSYPVDLLSTGATLVTKINEKNVVTAREIISPERSYSASVEKNKNINSNLNPNINIMKNVSLEHGENKDILTENQNMLQNGKLPVSTSPKIEVSISDTYREQEEETTRNTTLTKKEKGKPISENVIMENVSLSDEEKKQIITENQNRLQNEKLVGNQTSSPSIDELILETHQKDEVKRLMENYVNFQNNQKVIKLLQQIRQKAEPFENEIKKFTELKDSNKFYYIDESLRRLVDKLDDMYDDIGYNKVLRDERKKVYKFIFSLFEKLDKKVFENSQRIKEEQK